MDEVNSSLLRGGSGGQSSAAYVAELVGEDADLSLCVARDGILSKQVRKVVAPTESASEFGCYFDAVAPTPVAPVAATCPTPMELFVQTLGGDTVSIHVEQNITMKLMLTSKIVWPLQNQRVTRKKRFPRPKAIDFFF